VLPLKGIKSALKFGAKVGIIFRLKYHPYSFFIEVSIFSNLDSTKTSKDSPNNKGIRRLVASILVNV
jgi:hypothetical protein